MPDEKTPKRSKLPYFRLEDLYNESTVSCNVLDRIAEEMEADEDKRRVEQMRRLQDWSELADQFVGGEIEPLRDR